MLTKILIVCGLLTLSGCGKPELKWEQMATKTANEFGNVTSVEEIPRSEVAKCLHYCYEALNEDPNNCRMYSLLSHCYKILDAKREQESILASAKQIGCTVE